MKKNIIFFLVILLVAVSVFFGVYFFEKNKDDLKNNVFEGSGMKTTAENKKDDIVKEKLPKNAVMVTINTPKADQVIESPLRIKGEARGSWYFEAEFPIKLVNEKEEILAQTTARALSDWMTTDFVPFELTLNFNPGSSSEGMLIFEKSNPSSLSENDDAYKLPIFFANGTHISVDVYFGNARLKKELNDCKQVFSVERQVEKNPKIGQIAIEQLLIGPTEEEKENGYFTAIQEGTMINGLSIQHGVAFVDFNETLDANVAGACRVQAIRAQIEETLKQFPTVKEVQIYIGERNADVLQP